jgi:hypothetical protein
MEGYKEDLARAADKAEIKEGAFASDGASW